MQAYFCYPLSPSLQSYKKKKKKYPPKHCLSHFLPCTIRRKTFISRGVLKSQAPVRILPWKAQWHTSRPHCGISVAAKADLPTLCMVQTWSFNNWQVNGRKAKFTDLLLRYLFADSLSYCCHLPSQKHGYSPCYPSCPNTTLCLKKTLTARAKKASVKLRRLMKTRMMEKEFFCACWKVIKGGKENREWVCHHYWICLSYFFANVTSHRKTSCLSPQVCHQHNILHFITPLYS